MRDGAWDGNGVHSIGRGAGVLFEDKRSLGTVCSGALDRGESTTTPFFGIEAAYEVWPGTTLLAGAHVGLSMTEAVESSLVQDVSDTISNSFSLGIRQEDIFQDGDSLTLSVHQPLRVTMGNANLRLPTSQTLSGNGMYDSVQAGLAPSGREVDLELTYGIQPAEDMSIQAGMLLRTEPGHVADAAPEAALFLRFGMKF